MVFSVFYVVALCALCCVSGLLHSENGISKHIPLKSLFVSGEFYDSLGSLTIKQSWQNDALFPITSNYKFSLDLNAVVSGFKLKIGDKSWSGVVKAKETARAEYTEAVDAGVKSSLLEKISDKDYQVEIGPIAPGEVAEVEFRYLTRAPVQKDGSFHFVLPTNIAPKYTSPHTTNKADKEYAETMGSIPYVSQPPYTFEVDLMWHTGSHILGVTSATNEIKVETIGHNSARVRSVTAPENGDFSLSVRTEETTAVYVYGKESDGSTIMYVHNRIPAEVVKTEVPKVITIVLDRSGSMQGPKMEEAKVAVDHFLSLLPTTSDFGSWLGLAPKPKTFINLVSFGSQYQALYSHPVPVTAANIATIRQKVREFRANFGGTELLECLKDLLSGGPQAYETATQPVIGQNTAEQVIVLLTDGQVNNLHSITALLESQPGGTRIMSIGIGRDADRGLVERLADTTHGISRMLVDERDLTVALADVVEYINKQYYTDVRVVGHEASQCSKVLYPLLPVDMFLRLTTEQYRQVVETGLTITATDPVRGGAHVWSIPVSDCVPTSSLLAKMYANHLINEHLKELDRERHSPYREAIVADVVKLSVGHGIMNKETSFIVVSDEQIKEEDINKVVNTAVPHHNHMAATSFRTASAQTSGAPTKLASTSPSTTGANTLSGASLRPTTSRPMERRGTQPSTQPSAQPSAAPSVQPSAAPSAQPSAQPSSSPTTVLPSVQPSVTVSIDGVLKTTSAITDENLHLLQAFQQLSRLPDGSVDFSEALKLLLDYASLTQLETAANTVGVTLPLFVNATVALLLEQFGTPDTQLTEYVRVHVTPAQLADVLNMVYNLIHGVNMRE